MVKILFLVGLLTMCFNLKAQEGKSSILIKDITLISANDNGVKSKKSTILIGGETIKYIGQSKPAILGEYTEIDGEGKFLIPGLIDSHVPTPLS